MGNSSQKYLLFGAELITASIQVGENQWSILRKWKQSFELTFQAVREEHAGCSTRFSPLECLGGIERSQEFRKQRCAVFGTPTRPKAKTVPVS
jgi:hypothetical protein